MKMDNVVIGSLVLMFAVILFGDAIYSTFYPASMMLSPNDVKGIAGFGFVLIAVFIFMKARK
jgi:hypothetical protein